MHLGLASLLTAEDTVARSEMLFATLSLQQTGFQFEYEAAACLCILSKT